MIKCGSTFWIWGGVGWIWWRTQWTGTTTRTTQTAGWDDGPDVREYGQHQEHVGAHLQRAGRTGSVSWGGGRETFSDNNSPWQNVGWIWDWDRPCRLQGWCDNEKNGQSVAFIRW